MRAALLRAAPTRQLPLAHYVMVTMQNARQPCVQCHRATVYHSFSSPRLLTKMPSLSAYTQSPGATTTPAIVTATSLSPTSRLEDLRGYLRA